MQWEEKWKAMMSELRKDAKIPLLEDVGSVGDLSKGRQGTDADDSG